MSLEKVHVVTENDDGGNYEEQSDMVRLLLNMGQINEPFANQFRVEEGFSKNLNLN